MFPHSIRTTLSAVAAATLIVAIATGGASAAGKFGRFAPKIQPSVAAQALEVAPTGDGPAGEAECKRYEVAINSWLDAQAEALEALDEDATRTADRNTSMLQDEATDRGCFIIY